MEISKEAHVSDVTIYMPYANLTELPNIYEKTNPNVNHIGLNNNNISIFPKLEIFKQLKTLNLSCNNIIEIPASVRFLVSLNSIILDNNKIEDLSNLALCTDLGIISVRNNNIKEVSIFITELPHLRMLILDGNYIKEVSDEIKNMPKLFISIARTK